LGYIQGDNIGKHNYKLCKILIKKSIIQANQSEDIQSPNVVAFATKLKNPEIADWTIVILEKPSSQNRF
jgi:hypothetical protein